MNHWIEDVTLDAPDGHVWARPKPEACPNCPCCTRALCDTAKARTHPSVPHMIGLPCCWTTDDAGHAATVGCPCSWTHYRPGTPDCTGPNRIAVAPTRLRGVPWPAPIGRGFTVPA